MRHLRRYFQWYVLLLFAVLTAGVWQTAAWAGEHHGRVFLRVLDIGQGDSLLIESPSGNRVLIDGGPDDAVLARLGGALPFWARTIDLVILTHPHADHLDGLLHVLRRYRVGMVLESGVNHSIPEYSEEWPRIVRELNIPDIIARRGQVINIGGGAYLRVLAPFHSFVGVSPKNIHDATVVTEFIYASSTAMLMGDAEAPLEQMLVRSGDDLRAEVLKVGHHGSKTSTSETFLAAVRPKLAAISVGRRNRYGHPHQIILDRLAAAGISILRTDQSGDLTLVGDGRSFERK